MVMFSEPVTPPVVAIMWGSLSQDIPTFWQCGSICTWTPHFYRRAAAANRLWWPNVYSCWSCYVTIRIIKSFMVQLYVRPAYMSCHSGESLAGVKLPFPCTRILAQLLLVLPYHGSLFTRLSPQSQSSGSEHHHSPVMGTSCKK